MAYLLKAGFIFVRLDQVDLREAPKKINITIELPKATDEPTFTPIPATFTLEPTATNTLTPTLTSTTKPTSTKAKPTATRPLPTPVPPTAPPALAPLVLAGRVLVLFLRGGTYLTSLWAPGSESAGARM